MSIGDDLMEILIGADHGGKELKEFLLQQLESKGYQVKNIKTTAESEVDDYPDTAYLVCQAVRKDEANLGILICRDGIGMSIAANKYQGIRCARILNVKDAMKAKNHSAANVIALGSENGLNFKQSLELVEMFIKTPNPTEGRRIRRINKIMQIESGTYHEL